jgi:hypothetical protein
LKGNKVAAGILLTSLVGACHARRADPAAGHSIASVEQAVQPAFFARALQQIGGAHFHGLTRLSAGRAGAPPQAVTTTTDVWVDRAGNYRFHEENDRDGGRDVVLYGRELSVALRYGKMIRRVAEEPEPSRLLAEALGGPAAAVELVAAQARTAPGGTETVGGSRASASIFSLGDGAAAVPGQTLAGLRAWRGTVSIQSLSGRMLVEDASGALLKADLSATFKATGPDGPEEGALQIHTVLSDIASTPPIQPPVADELVLRQRIVPEMHELLRGIAEPRAAAEPQRRAAAQSQSREARP